MDVAADVLKDGRKVGLDMAFPKSENRPTTLPKVLSVAIIAGLVSLDLVGPELGVCRWRLIVARAAMPEAPVDEHGDPRTFEDYVGSGFAQSNVHPVSEASVPQCAPQLHFDVGARVAN